MYNCGMNIALNILTRVCHPTTNQLTYLPDPYGFIPHRLSHTMCTCVADVQRDMVGGATPPLSLTHEVMIGGEELLSSTLAIPLH